MPATDGLYVFRGQPQQRQQTVFQPPRTFTPQGLTDRIFLFRGNPPPRQPDYYPPRQRQQAFVSAGADQTIVVTGTPPANLAGFPTFTGGSFKATIGIYINGVDVSGHTKYSIQIKRTLGGQASCQFDLYDPQASIIPSVGQDVKIVEFGVTRFAGKIDSFPITRATEVSGDLQLFMQVNCLDYSAIFARRIVIQTYPAGSILKDVYWDLINTYAKGEGITHNNVDGFTFLNADITFNYTTIADCLNQLRDAYGEDWWVDFNRDLHTHAFLNFPAAPFSLTETSGNWVNMQVSRATAGYRNKQYVRSNVNLSVGGFSDTFTGDGVISFFVTRFPLTAAPSVTVNGVAQTVYAEGVDKFGQTGVYWIPNGYGIQFSPQVGPALGAVIVVTYGTFFTNVVWVQNSAEIAARAAAEGDTGIYESLFEAKDLDADSATTLAQGLLSRSGSLPVKIQFETFTPGLDVGMLLTVNIPIVGVNQNLVITEIDSVEQPVNQDLGQGSRFRYTVYVDSNLDQGAGFENYMERFMVRTAQGQVAPTPEIHVWDLGVGGDLILGSDWTTIAVAAIHFQNSGLLINSTVSSRVATVGQDIYLRVLMGVLPDGSDGVTIFGKTDSSNLVLKAGSTQIAEQGSFTPSPLQVVGADKGITGVTQFTIQGKYVPKGGGTTLVNAQDVLVELMLQY